MEKIKLFVKKNKEEKKDDRKLIEKIGDWFNDEENLPLVTYGVGIAIGLGCGYLLGHTFGKSAQAAKDAKEFDEFLKCLDDGFKEMQPKYLNMNDLVKIDAFISKAGRPGLRLTGLDIYGKPLTKELVSDTVTAKSLAEDLINITKDSQIADTMRDMGMKNVQVF